MKKLIIGMILIMVMPLVLAEQQFFGTGQQYDCIQIIQTCDNCTSVNFTGVTYPDLTFKVLDLQGENHITVFNNSFCETSQVGTYIINSVGDLNGKQTSGSYTIDISQSGKDFKGVLNEYLLFTLIFIILYVLLILSFKYIEKNIAMIASLGILLFGAYIVVYGIASLNNIYTQSFGIINIGIGGYILLRAAVEKVQEEFDISL